MLSRSTTVLVVVIVTLSILTMALAVQAGYMNLFSAKRPILWKTRYALATDERDELSGRIDDMSSELNSTLERAVGLQSQVNGLSEELTNLSTQTEELRLAKDELSGEVDQLRSEYQSRNESCAAAEAQVFNLSSLLEKTGTQLREVRSERDMLQDSYSEARIQLAMIQTNLSQIEEEIRSLNESNVELHELLLDSEQRIEAFEDAISLQGEIHRKFEWTYLTEKTLTKGISGQKGSGFNRSEYLSVAARKHFNDTEDGSYRDLLSIECQDVDDIADRLYSQGATDLQRVSNIIKFVQYLPYIYDSGDDNYIRHPLETLIEGGGDCEDTSVLAAQLLRKAGPEGFPVVLFTVDTDHDDEIDHMLVGVSLDGATGTTCEADGVDYYVCETTSTYYRVGQLPPGYEIVDAIKID